MPQEWVPFIIGGVFLLIIPLAVWSAIQARKRREALQAWAAGRGLSFDTGRDGSMDDRYAAFSCLRQGSDRYAYNIMRGRVGARRVEAFDYHYETYTTDSEGKRTTTHHHFSAVIVAAGLPLKPLMVRPENVFDKIAGAFGFDDIDFESAEFSRRYCVKSPDRKWAYDVLHARTIEFLMQQPKLMLEFDHAHALVWRGSKLNAEGYEAALGVAMGVLDRLPEYVVEQQARGGAGA
jgi:hypothetical protein